MARTKKTTTEGATAASTTTTAAKDAKSVKGRYAYFLTAEITFITPLLATNPGNETIYKDFIANDEKTTAERRAEEVEMLGVDEVEKRGMTVFLREPDNPMVPLLKDYTWLGYLKSRAKALAKIDGTVVHSMKAYVKEVNDLITVTPRFQPLTLPDGTDTSFIERKTLPDVGDELVDYNMKSIVERLAKLEGVAIDGVDALERPLRAETMQGDRVALAKSESVPAGTKVTVTFRCERKEGLDLVKECLDYGDKHGTGQWRNAGYGRFIWKKIDSWKELIEQDRLTEEDFPLR